MIGIDALGAAQSGISAALSQVAATAHNLANLQTTTPMEGAAFQGDKPLFAEDGSGGVRMADLVPAGTEEGIPVSQPDNPQSDADGFVRIPDIDIAGELVNVITAEHAVAANVTTIHRAVDSYRDLLAMTHGDRRQQAGEVISL